MEALYMVCAAINALCLVRLLVVLAGGEWAWMSGRTRALVLFGIAAGSTGVIWCLWRIAELTAT